MNPAARHINSYPNPLKNDKPFVILRLAYWVPLFGYFVLVSASVGPMLFFWALLWIAGVIATILAHKYPLVEALVYILITYSVPRYMPPYHMSNNLALPESIAYFAIVTLILDRLEQREKIQFGGFSVG